MSLVEPRLRVPDAVLPPVANPEPVGRAVMVQRWTNLAFVHWRYDPAAVQRLLPAGVEVDTFDGDAWVGLIPFTMTDLGLPGLVPLPFVGRFPEVNVRTYVRCGDRRGVWFFSLDIDRWLATVVARLAFSLPYCKGDVGHERWGDLVETSVDRSWPRSGETVGTRMTVRIGDETDATAPLPRFLTGRWGLITRSRRLGPIWGPVDHEPWTLHRAELVDLDDGLVAAAGLPAPGEPASVLWSPGVDVRIGRPRRIRT